MNTDKLSRLCGERDELLLGGRKTKKEGDRYDEVVEEIRKILHGKN